MPAGRVDPSEAEAYELAEISDPEDYSPNGTRRRSKQLHRGTDDGEEDGEGFDELKEEERERLLHGKPPRRSGEVPLHGPDEEETVGKGTNVEALIARSVPSTDDPSLPTLTLRVLLLGSFFCILGASTSQMFYFKSNAPSLTSFFVILSTYPLGHLLANPRFVPNRRILGWELNPGRFSIKEAILISVVASSGGTSAYATDILTIMDLYFHEPLGPIASIVLILTTQCIGYGMAGMLQSLLVTSPAMYWPSTLVVVQLFTTLYSTTSTRLSDTARHLVQDRLKVFLLVFVAIFTYQFFPMLLFPTLTSVSVLCLLNNNSWWMRTLGSGYNGTGILDFTFDWSGIGATGPLYTPFWALMNYYGGIMFFVWIMTPLLLVTNFWNARDFPSPVGPGLYTSNYKKFDVLALLGPGLTLNDEAWEKMKPMLLTPYFAVTYAVSFAALTSILVHVYLWHWDDIKAALSGNKGRLDDVHNVLMRSYAPVPQSWYILLLVVNFGASILLVKLSPLQTPIWALMLAVAIAAVFLVPIGIVYAVSNTKIGLNVLTEFVAGVLMPGKPIGNVTFKCLGYMAMSQALELTSDLKLGWYTSIPPREMFACQIIGTVLGCITNYFTLISVLSSKRQYLDGTLTDPTGQWTGRAPQVFYSASIIWGAVAPARFFAGKYMWLYSGFVIGALAPIALYYAHRRWPGYKLHKVVVPIFCTGGFAVPQIPSNTIMSGIIVAVVANKWFAIRYPELHGKYIYVVSSALDAGTSMTALSIYILFGLLIPWDGPRWWGNSSIDTEHCIPGS